MTDIDSILTTTKTIAVVGWSTKTERPSHWIADYLEQAGFTVWRINPIAESSSDMEIWPSIEALPATPDIINIFRAPPQVPGIVELAIRAKVPCVWMQPGTVNDEATAMAKTAGIHSIAGPCIYREHRRWIGDPVPDGEHGPPVH